MTHVSEIAGAIAVCERALEAMVDEVVAPARVDVLLIDLSSIAYPIFHMAASDPNPNATSEQTVARVRALASGVAHVAVCCDSGKSFRQALDPTYKANRLGTDRAAVHHQINLAIDVLKADGFPVWSAPGFEADDLIASAAVKACERDGVHVTIASADKDLLQLVCERVTAKSLKDGSCIDLAAVQQKFGVLPEQMRDYLTLVGDASDNIKGAAGIGPKTAAQLLAEYRTLDELYRRIDTGATPGLTPTRRSSLVELRDRLDVVRGLITLRVDVPLDVDALFAPRVAAPLPEGQRYELEEEEHYHDPVNGDQIDTSTGEVMPALPDVLEAPSPAPQAAAAPVASIPAGRPGENSAGLALQPHANGVGAVSQAEVLPAPAEWERQLEPRSLGQASNLAKAMHASKLFSAYGSPEGVLATVLAGRELGIQAMASLRAFHIVENKPTLAADTLRALVLRSGAAEYFRCSERTPTRATFVTKRKGDPEPMSLTYTIEEAQAAGVSFKDGSSWKKSPADMLVARASSKLARLAYADVVAGLYAPEEFSND
jgi:5'-3' exonuclease